MTETKFVEIQQIELACRIAEAVIGWKRPSGKSASEAMTMMPVEQRIDFIRGADAAIAYLAEAVEATGDEAVIKYQAHKGGTA